VSDFLSVAATAHLLGLKKRAVQDACKNGKYTTRQVSGKGGLRYEIALESLPETAQNAWKKQQADLAITHLVVDEKAAKLVEEIPHSPPLAKGGMDAAGKALVATKGRELSDYTFVQRQQHRAIQTIMQWLDSYQGSRAKALRALNQGYKDGTLSSPMVCALDHCRQKTSGKPKTGEILTQNTVDKWLARHKKQGNYIPQVRETDMTIRPWHAAAIALHQRPQKTAYTTIVELLQKQYPEVNYDLVYDFLAVKLSKIDLKKGRHTGMQLRELKYTRRRTSAGMEPWDEVHADGWNTHFTAPHPITGEYVTYEVWDFHDVATRYVPPLSVGLTENYEVIAKGIENAIRDYGRMATLQTDSTKIVKKNKKFTGDPLVSICDLAGVTVVHPATVGNAHANGIAENWHSWIDKEARVLSTYQAKNMDSLTLRRTQKLTAKLVKARAADDVNAVAHLTKEIAKTSPGILFESYQQAIDWLEGIRIKWNNKPHRTLKKVKDPVSGRMRHQTPQECLDEFIANGWEPMRVDEDELLDLFRPRVKKFVRKGVVKPYGDMRFRHAELDHYEGLEVVVAYDIMDYRQVWVSNLKGGLICIALFDEACAYRAQTAVEANQEKRALAQIRSLEKKADTIRLRAGLDESNAIESTATRVLDYALLEPESVDETPKRSLDELYAKVAEQEPEDDVKQLTAEEMWLKYYSIEDEDEKVEKREIDYGI